MIKNRPIVFLEFGVAQGAIFERWLQTNTNPDSMFYGFDTFRGLPEDAKHFIKITPKGTFDLDGKPPDIDYSRAEFVVGLFQETLVDFIAGEFMREPDQRLVVHLDADLFSASLFVSSTLDPIMRPGTVIIINNFNSVLGTFRAFSDYIEAFQRDYTILGVTDPSYSRVALEVV